MFPKGRGPYTTYLLMHLRYYGSSWCLLLLLRLLPKVSGHKMHPPQSSLMVSLRHLQLLYLGLFFKIDLKCLKIVVIKHVVGGV